MYALLTMCDYKRVYFKIVPQDRATPKVPRQSFNGLSIDKTRRARVLLHDAHLAWT